MKQKRVEIDYEKLEEFLFKHKISKKELSTRIGRSYSFIACLKTYNTINESLESLICEKLDVPLGTFIKNPQTEESEETTNKTVEQFENVKILENIYEAVNQLKQVLEDIQERNDQIYKKQNTNTVQLEKIKESLKTITETEFEKACKFLQNQLIAGPVDGAEILMKAEAEGLKRSEIMKAKKELGVRIDSKGYGKNQKSFWYIPI